MRSFAVMTLGLGSLLSSMATPPSSEGWRDLAGLRFSAAEPVFAAELAADAQNDRARLGLALSLWAGQPTRGPDFNQAVQLMQEVAEKATDRDLASSARFMWGRAIWLGGDAVAAEQIFLPLAERMDSTWAEQAAVACIQISVASSDETKLDELVTRAADWSTRMTHPSARLGLHLAMAELHLVNRQDRAAGPRHLEAALTEESIGFRLRADLLLSAGRLLASVVPGRAAEYLQRFLRENPLDGRRELAESVLATLVVNPEGTP